VKEIEILNDFPIVLTKDVDWEPPVAKSGAIILLPEDAVLVAIPYVISATDSTQPTKQPNEPPSVPKASPNQLNKTEE